MRHFKKLINAKCLQNRLINCLLSSLTTPRVKYKSTFSSHKGLFHYKHLVQGTNGVSA